MGSVNLQRAIAQLIRAPMGLDQILSREEALTETEVRILRQMATDPNLVKYGRSMNFLRGRDALRELARASEVIPAPLLRRVYDDFFAPNALKIREKDLGFEFAKFAIQDRESIDVLNDAVPYAVDVLKFEWAEMWIEKSHDAEYESSLPANSRLVHDAFVIVDLEHDIPDFVKAQAKGDAAPVPVRKPTKVFFMRTDGNDPYRMFKIDAQLEGFLQAERSEKTAGTPVEGLPPAYPTLVKLGLCQPLEA